MLFTDVALKGPMDGSALARAAGRHRRLPVLYTSGHSHDAILRDGRLDAGAELLQKPFTSDALARRARALLDGAVARVPSTMAG